MSLGARRAWVFDLDGTLTRAQHDFAGMRRQLGFGEGTNLLEGLAGLSDEARAEAEATIEAWEWEHADRAEPAPGVPELLGRLHARGVRIGVLTRNLAPIARRTLAVTGLDRWFAPDDVLGRTCAAPKPAPDGIVHLLNRWRIPADRAVMVGDYLHDLMAGRAAGTTTILLGPVPEAWRAWADLDHPDATSLLHALEASP